MLERILLKKQDDLIEKNNETIIVHIIAIVSVTINFVVYNIWLFSEVCK